MAEEEIEPFAGVPDSVRGLIEDIGFLEELSNPDTEEMYAPLRMGKCMTCHTDLGSTTILFIAKQGIVAGYCGGACLQDQAVLAWIVEQHSDIVDGISFRGGKGDEPEESDEG